MTKDREQVPPRLPPSSRAGLPEATWGWRVGSAVGTSEAGWDSAE